MGTMEIETLICCMDSNYSSQIICLFHGKIELWNTPMPIFVTIEYI
jgi:hypothetical protein